MDNLYIGQLLYRLFDGRGYYVITDIDKIGHVYVNPIHDLHNMWFVHELRHMSKMYRETSIVEQVLYGSTDV